MENRASALMLANQRHLEELPTGGELFISRRVAERYSLIEWLEFEKLFIERAKELGLEVVIVADPFSYRTLIRWRPAVAEVPGGPK